MSAFKDWVMDEQENRQDSFLDKLEKFPDKLVHSSTMDQALLNVKDLHNYFNKKTKLI